jgi:hypothetical protein
MVGRVPAAGPRPRRARQLIPAGLPRRVELIAACGTVIVLAHVVLAPLTLVLAAAFVAVGKVSRWRLGWLFAPAAAGLIGVLAAGPAHALAGFAAGPSAALRDLGRAGHAWHPLAALDAERGLLAGQLPVALIGGAAEAALIGWLDWLHTDEWAVPSPRPGLVAAARQALAARGIRAGAVLTRDGCALGVVPSTGAAAELRWTESAHGTLITGAAAQPVTLTGLQVVHGALRRRKPVIVLDPGGDGAIARAVTAACAATGAPLLTLGMPMTTGASASGASTPTAPVGPSTTGFPSTGPSATGPSATGLSPTRPSATGLAPTGFPAAGLPAPGGVGASRLWGHRAAGEGEPPVIPATDLGRAVRERLAVLLPVHSAEQAAGACAGLASLAEDLSRIGVDGDALVWAPRGELLPAQALAPLLRDAATAGLSILIGTTSSAAAAELAGLVGTVLVHRVADRELAATLAARTGTRLLPAPGVTASNGAHADAAPYADAGLRARGGPYAAGWPEHAETGPWPDAGSPPAAVLRAGTGLRATAAAQATSGPLDATPAAVTAGLMPSPAISAQALLTLGQREFVLAVGLPRQRLIALGHLVPARLPVGPGRPPTDESRPEAAL